MPNRRRAGFVSTFYNPLQVPNAPTGVSATAGDASATVSFTAPGNVGGGSISAYYALSNTGVWATGSSSPISVSGLTNDVPCTFQVWALNAFGPSPYSSASGSVTPDGTRALFMGGFASTVKVNTIDYLSIVGLGNATDFGDLLAADQFAAACASTTRALHGGGDSNSNVIQYVTISSIGNATDFGDLSQARGYLTSFSSSTRGVFALGLTGSGSNTIDYVTIASVGNATDFGDATLAGGTTPAGVASPTRGVIAGGFNRGNVMDYVTIASAGNATDFGDLQDSRYEFSGLSNSTRGVFSGGSGTGSNNLMQYITIASTGNAVNFGNLTAGGKENGSTSNRTRGIIALGYIGSYTNRIDYITIETTGNSADFGDLSQARSYAATTSSLHGGLQ